VRHPLVVIHLLNQAREAAAADADQRLEHQRQAGARTEAAEPHRLATTMGSLARRARALVARTT
jgi:hypothetical protein